MVNVYVKKSYDVKAATIIKNLEKRNMLGYYFETIEDANKKIVELIEPGTTVAWGDSKTLNEIGIKSILKNSNYNIIDRDEAKDFEDRIKIMKKALTCDTFLTSTNAITMHGELVNIDGRGNRAAAICFGPDSVIFVAGMNKVTGDLGSAIDRIKIDACVPNAIRYETGTACSITGKCVNCTSEKCICGHTLITRFSKVHNRIKVILIGESLGF